VYLVKMQSKICEGTCGLDLPLDRFYPHPKGGHSPLCRTCTVADNKLRRQNPTAHRQALVERKQKKAAAKAAMVAAVSEKACTKCGAVKPLWEFREHRGLYGRASWCLECERQYTRDWTADHREEFNAKKRATWAANPKTAEEKAEAIVRARVWYAGNKKRALESARRWVEENRDAANIIQARRRARKAAVVNTLTFEEWSEILNSFNNACAYCLRTDLPMTMDHVLPISKGGPHTAANVVPACKPCNCRKHDRSMFVMLETA